MKFEQPFSVEQKSENVSSLVEHLKPASDFYKGEAKKLYNELSAKYEMKKVIDWESQKYPLKATDKIKEIISNEADLEIYEEFAQMLNLIDEIKGTSINPDSQGDLREKLNARAKKLFEELDKKYDIKKAIDWQSQQYPLEITQKIRDIITDEADLATYEEFARSLHAVNALEKKDTAN